MAIPQVIIDASEGHAASMFDADQDPEARAISKTGSLHFDRRELSIFQGEKLASETREEVAQEPDQEKEMLLCKISYCSEGPSTNG